MFGVACVLLYEWDCWLVPAYCVAYIIVRLDERLWVCVLEEHERKEKNRTEQNKTEDSDAGSRYRVHWKEVDT
jgi:hypothetical protein